MQVSLLYRDHTICVRLCCVDRHSRDSQLRPCLVFRRFSAVYEARHADLSLVRLIRSHCATVMFVAYLHAATLQLLTHPVHKELQICVKVAQTVLSMIERCDTAKRHGLQVLQAKEVVETKRLCSRSNACSGLRWIFWLIWRWLRQQ